MFAGRHATPRALILLATTIALALLSMPAGAQSADLEVTPEMEEAVSKGLAWLAANQREDGGWPGQYGDVSGVVGLAMLAFLAHGDMPGEGEYGRVIDRAVDYIVSNQQQNGLLMGRGGGSPMYSHGFATLALAEVYGSSADPRVGPALKKAVGLILEAQNQTGGWRYSVNSRDADTTVSGAQMVALRAAAQAGIEVPMNVVEDGVGFFKNCYCSGGGFGYTSAGGPNVARSSIGLLVYSLSGHYRDPETRETADWLIAHMGEAVQQDYYGYYGTYYGSQAMYQAGGRYWRQWNETVIPQIMAGQQVDGSWTGRGQGPLLATAFALLSLEVNYNFLPIYQR